MATVLAVHNSDGCVGRCDAKCYNAKGSICKCVCGGANHGAGLNQAVANVAETVEGRMEHLGSAEKWEEYKESHGLINGQYALKAPPVQLEMPGLEGMPA